MGLEPMTRPWKGRVLPLHHTRSFTCGLISRGAGTRTRDLYVPNVARYQLRYTPSLQNSAILSLFCDGVYADMMNRAEFLLTKQSV